MSHSFSLLLWQTSLSRVFLVSFFSVLNSSYLPLYLAYLSLYPHNHNSAFLLLLLPIYSLFYDHPSCYDSKNLHYLPCYQGLSASFAPLLSQSSCSPFSYPSTKTVRSLSLSQIQQSDRFKLPSLPSFLTMTIVSGSVSLAPSISPPLAAAAATAATAATASHL